MEMKEKVYVKRKIDKKTWTKIASEVWNLQRERPYWKVVRAAFRELSSDKNQKKTADNKEQQPYKHKTTQEEQT